MNRLRFLMAFDPVLIVADAADLAPQNQERGGVR